MLLLINASHGGSLDVSQHRHINEEILWFCNLSLHQRGSIVPRTQTMTVHFLFKWAQWNSFSLTGRKMAFSRGSQLPLVAVAQPRLIKRD
jgi:hypothetical protein